MIVHLVRRRETADLLGGVLTTPSFGLLFLNGLIAFTNAKSADFDCRAGDFAFDQWADLTRKLPQKLQTVSGFLAMMVISVHIKVDSAQF
jgi:hypothetical protein